MGACLLCDSDAGRRADGKRIKIGRNHHVTDCILLSDKNNQRQELSNGNCSGAVYMAIWDYCESELDIDVRFPAPQTEETLDCALMEGKLASDLLEALREQDLPELAVEIAPDWDLTVEAVQSGLETLCSHLELVRDDTALLYEMI